MSANNWADWFYISLVCISDNRFICDVTRLMNTAWHVSWLSEQIQPNSILYRFDFLDILTYFSMHLIRFFQVLIFLSLNLSCVEDKGFWICHLCFVCLVVFMLSRLFIAVLWSPAGKGLTSWLLLVIFIVFSLLSHVVSLVTCGTWLYRLLIFAAFFFTFMSVFNLRIPFTISYFWNISSRKNVNVTSDLMNTFQYF